MSALPIAQYCGQAPRLSKVMGAGRAAATSRAFHAMCANEPDAANLFARLSTQEQKNTLSWKKPSTIVLGEGVSLDYESADKETEVCLAEDGRVCSPDDPDCMTVGHIDMAWVRVVNGERVAFIGDIKKTAWTTTDGPDSLQLIAYAFAFAAMHDCVSFVCGIWNATDGEWTWGATYSLYSLEAGEMWQRVVAAALNESEEYCSGPHCQGCYQRLGCPAHAIRGLEGTELAALSTGITKDNALDLLLKLKAAEQLVEKAMDTMKAWVRENGGISDGKGKVYKPIRIAGRVSIDQEAMKRDGVLEKYQKRGEGGEQYRFVKE
jgi:hypothetical protein